MLVYLDKHKYKKHLPLDIKMEMAINSQYGINSNIYANYIFKGEKLSKYCKKNNISYSSISCRIFYDRRKGKFEKFSTENMIEEYIERYNQLKYIKQVKMAFNMLRNNNYLTNDYKYICEQLDINYRSLSRIKYENIDMKKLIIIAWYSGNIKINEKISVTKKRLKQILSYEDISINNLVGLCKISYDDAYVRLIDYEQYYLMGIAKRVLKNYNIILSSEQYKELIAMVKFELINSIDKSVLKFQGKLLIILINVYIIKY